MVKEYDELTKRRIAITTLYFEKVDNGDPTVLDLLVDDIQFFFPKGGVQKGKEAWVEFVQYFGSYLTSIKHDFSSFNYFVQGDHIVVEGKESGVMSNGVAWPDGKISQGLFCNVFEFEGELIKRLHVYVDPDFASADEDRVMALRGGY